MDFYTRINHHYDHLFPVKKQAVELIESLTEGNGPIIDLAAGTGNEVIALASKNYRTIGLDLNEEMIKTAKEKSKSVAEKAEFYVKDIRRLNDLNITNASSIYCIGNSIVHLSSQAEISQVLEDSYHSLESGGSLMIQTVNFDWVKNQHITSLPALNNPDHDVVFERHYIHHESSITFKGILHSGTEKNEIETMLLPITSIDWETMIRKSSFQNFSIYSDFKKASFSPNSPALILIITKN
ncbi:class I SAM-dependent methyltransferase [Salisediminibacterium beveridgei]|uniref:Methyltransferase n=1 Tax=Salisediminibacterium beveridgei TaxID=632773 RepID=A0A1D7QV49_9BACI|nr:class I SAM-dependent methyltransferase [Salisediminibacterium beveridgei]AOM82896.1 Methyltransferase [Salisediminibacterium beveridgei]